MELKRDGTRPSTDKLHEALPRPKRPTGKRDLAHRSLGAAAEIERRVLSVLSILGHRGALRLTLERRSRRDIGP